MIAVDTNVIVRLLTQDDKEQFQKSLALFESHDIFLLDTVILETEWVLRFAYNFEAEAICNAFKKLFGLANIKLNSPESMAQAIEWHLKGMDFADALHLAQCQNIDTFFTFDNKLISKSKTLTHYPVQKP